MFTKVLFLLVAVYTSGVCSSYSGEYVSGHEYSHHTVPYHGPLAKPVVLKSGYLADTHEVAAAKGAHLAALAKYSHGYGHGGDYGYGGSYGGGYGYGGSYGGNYGYGGSYGGNYGNEHSYGHGDLRYHGPIAIPHVLHNGHIADTHEVAVAKAEHLAAVAKARSHGGYGHGYSGGYGHGYSGEYASGYGGYHGYSHHAAPYHGHLAKPVVLKSGYLADTHEVAAAKEHHLHALHSASHHGHYDYHY